MDPWFSPLGAFHSGWFQWPPNQEYFITLIKNLKKSEKKTYVYISHEHEDHFCEYTIKKLLDLKNIHFIIPSFEDKSFEKYFRKIKNIIILNDEETFYGEDFYVKIYVDDQGINHDSAILVKSDGFSFFNQNDCKIFDRLDSILPGLENIDFYACQYSGANWFPSTYSMDEKFKNRICTKRNIQKFINIFDSIIKLKPRNYIASAGPVCFLDPEEEFININEYNFPHADKLFSYLNKRINQTDIKCNLISPTVGKEINIKNHKFNIPDKNKRAQYRISNYKGRPNLYISLKDVIKFFQKKISLIAELIPECDFQSSIIFSFNDNNIKVDFDKLKVSAIDKNNLPSKYLRLTAPEWWFNLLVNNERGQTLCLTMAPRLERYNIEYCLYQNLFLFTNLDDVFIAFKQTINIDDTRFTIKLDNGDFYEINRFCPHQGADLLNIKICNGILTCPRHNISFNILNNGKAEGGHTLTLNAKKINHS